MDSEVKMFQCKETRALKSWNDMSAILGGPVDLHDERLIEFWGIGADDQRIDLPKETPSPEQLEIAALLDDLDYIRERLTELVG